VESAEEWKKGKLKPERENLDGKTQKEQTPKTPQNQARLGTGLSARQSVTAKKARYGRGRSSSLEKVLYKKHGWEEGWGERVLSARGTKSHPRARAEDSEEGLAQLGTRGCEGGIRSKKWKGTYSHGDGITLSKKKLINTESLKNTEEKNRDKGLSR